MKMDNQRLREEVIEKIEIYIIKNKLKPDERLPSERIMCEMWDINRKTLRSAIKQLIEEGKVYSKKGSGTYIARSKLVKNLQDIEGFKETAQKANRDISTQIVSIDTCEANKNIGRKMRLILGHKLLRIVRLRLLEGIPVMYETSYLDLERFINLDEYITEEASLYEILQAKYGVQITSGEEKISIAYCDKDEADYLGMGEGSPVIYISGIVADEDGVVFECFKSITRSEYVCFASELKRK